LLWQLVLAGILRKRAAAVLSANHQEFLALGVFSLEIQKSLSALKKVHPELEPLSGSTGKFSK
jgi:hypothetical protein